MSTLKFESRESAISYVDHIVELKVGCQNHQLANCVMRLTVEELNNNSDEIYVLDLEIFQSCLEMIDILMDKKKG